MILGSERIEINWERTVTTAFSFFESDSCCIAFLSKMLLLWLLFPKKQWIWSCECIHSDLVIEIVVIKNSTSYGTWGVFLAEQFCVRILSVETHRNCAPKCLVLFSKDGSLLSFTQRLCRVRT